MAKLRPILTEKLETRFINEHVFSIYQDSQCLQDKKCLMFHKTSL